MCFEINITQGFSRHLRFESGAHASRTAVSVTWGLSFLLQVLCAVAESHGLICLCGAVLCEYHGTLSSAERPHTVCSAEPPGALCWVAGHLRCGAHTFLWRSYWGCVEWQPGGGYGGLPLAVLLCCPQSYNGSPEDLALLCGRQLAYPQVSIPTLSGLPNSLFSHKQ